MQQPGDHNNLDENDLLDYLRRPRAIDPQASLDFECRLKASDWTVTTLAEKYLSFITSEIRDRKSWASGAPSLASIARKNTIDMLTLTNDLKSDISTTVRSLDTPLLKELLRDCRMPYHILRAFLHHQAEPTRKLVDVDEAVLHNEKYLRTLQSMDRSYLVTIEQLSKIVSPCTMCKDLPGQIEFRRKDPPLGGFEYLDNHRTRHQSLLTNTTMFRKAFDASALGRMLHGLDWSNVLVAGFRVLRTIITLDDSSKISVSKVSELYIHGLSAEVANQKLQHIWDVWCAGLLRENVSQEGILYTPEEITFLTTSFQLRIRLKLFRTSGGVLLDLHTGINAVGYDGSEVLMLPSCARAIETGYSIFNMNVINEWPDTRYPRPRIGNIFEHAFNGFGLRILPSYAKLLSRGMGSEFEPGLKVMRRIWYKANATNDAIAHHKVYDFWYETSSYTVWRDLTKTFGGLSTFWAKFIDRLHDDYFETEELPFIKDDMTVTSHAAIESYVDQYNNAIFVNRLQPAISAKLGLPTSRTDYRGYLTRRVRAKVYSDDLSGIMRTQLTSPLLIPQDLEDSINDALRSEAAFDLPAHFLSKPMFIPVYNASAHSPASRFVPSIPPLQDISGEEGNLRYFVETNKSRWIGQSVLVEGIYFVTRALISAMHPVESGLDINCKDREAVGSVASCLQGTLPLPEALHNTSKPGIDCLEATLFRNWVLSQDSVIFFDDALDGSMTPEFQAPTEPDLDDIPETRFWNDGDEGEWDGPNVPAWRDV